MSSLKNVIQKLLDEYLAAKTQPFSGSQFGSFVRKDIPSAFYSTKLVDETKYLVSASVGKGNWAIVPWICIFDRTITTSATKGVYVVYLLSKDTNTMYLTLNQGCTDIRSSHSKKETIQIMRARAKEITSVIDYKDFRVDESIHLGDGLTELAELYQKGTICYKSYKKGAIPTEEELRIDLLNVLEIYSDYIHHFECKDGEEPWWPSESIYSPGFTKEQWLELLNNPEIIGPVWGGALAMFYTEKEGATCTAIGKKFGKNPSSIRSNCMQLGQRINKITHCPVFEENGKTSYWPILFLGRNANKDEQGSYVWKLRPELYSALTEFGINRYLPKADTRIGIFDSWEIVDENSAIKTCDKSFFDYNGSGVPKEVCWFFGADKLEQGETISITLNFEGSLYTGRIANESSDRRRVRIFWSADLGKQFAEKRSPGIHKAIFKKSGENTYDVMFQGEENPPLKTWLLSWNPSGWNWEDYHEIAAKTHFGELYNDSWTCASTKVQPGDRVFLIALGMGAKNGIIASGHATSESYEDEHWDTQKAAQGNKTKYVNVCFDWISDYETDPYLKQSSLKELFPNQEWSPMGSGISIRDQYVNQLEEEWEKVIKGGGEAALSVKEIIERIKAYIAENGFTYEEGLIENFYLSLKTKPFVILAGTSGTGKTRLVKLFAEAIGATGANGRYQMVSVRPDWSDSTDLFGHVDLNGHFVPGVIIDFVKRAEMDIENPYILCLDEMNLARVEYYLSDILSVIETRDFDNLGNIVTDPLVLNGYYGSDTDASEKYGEIRLPENLYIVGTVNMDETTFPFSKKVLDRANTIEFSHVNLIPQSIPEEDAAAMALSNSFLKANYLLLKQCTDMDAVAEFCTELQEINGILMKANAHVGYRIRDEIVFYLLNNRESELLPDNDAMDNEIMQKILPRLQGSSAAVKEMLCDLFRRCASDFEGYGTNAENLSKKMSAAAEKPDCRYKNSAKKIAFMVRRFEEDGFTSYWL